MSKNIKELDLIIIGGGLVGFIVVMYVGRVKLNILLLENKLLGG